MSIWIGVEQELPLAILGPLFSSFFWILGAVFVWKGGKYLGVWENPTTVRVVVSLLIPAAAVGLTLAVKGLFKWLRVASKGQSSPAAAAIVSGFSLISILWLAGHVFEDLEKASAILPPIPLLAAYLIVGAIISIKFEPEISGNIIIDAGLIAVACLGVGFLLSMGFWMWLVSLPITSLSRVLAWVITWLGASFVIRCLIGEKEDSKESVISSRSFLSRLWAAVPLAMLGLAIAMALMSFTYSELVSRSSELNTTGPEKVSDVALVPCVVVVTTILLRRTRKAVKPPRGGAVASTARGFGYGAACLCIVSAGIGAYLGYFIILPWWVLVIGVLLCGVFIYGRDELTGNAPLDGLLVAALIVALAHAAVSGPLCAIELELLSRRVFWIWLLGSLVIGLAIRVFHWATD